MLMGDERLRGYAKTSGGLLLIRNLDRKQENLLMAKMRRDGELTCNGSWEIHMCMKVQLRMGRNTMER